jgi:hypothetical protein
MLHHTAKCVRSPSRVHPAVEDDVKTVDGRSSICFSAPAPPFTMWHRSPRGVRTVLASLLSSTTNTRYSQIGDTNFIGFDGRITESNNTSY